jgi:glycerol-3-phosphate acyltransferase PlsY
VTRVIGKKFGIATLVLDVLKGLIAVTVIPFVFGVSSDYAKMFCALGAVCGHNWTIFLGFKGGKGVATTAGALIGLMPVVFLSVFFVWCAVFTVWRYVSVASITAAIFLPIFLFLYGESLIFKLLGFIVAVVGIIRHKENIKRLLKGEERKLML